VTRSIAQKAVWFIETNLRENIDLEAIAAAAGASRYHLCRAFTACFGTPPMQYVRRRRMTEAVALLRDERQTIIDVAMCCGYESQASFSRSFQAILGVTPGRVRNGSAPIENRLQEPFVVQTSTSRTPEPVRFVVGHGFTVAGLRRRYTMETNGAIPGQWAEFVPRVDEILGRVDGRSYGVCFAPADDDSFAYMSSVQVDRDAVLPKDFARLTIDPVTYAVFEHRGSAATLRDTVTAIWDRGLSSHGLRPASAPDFELYPADYDPLDEHGIVEIWVPIDRELSENDQLRRLDPRSGT
jgi:AraC family transcriptional regulator